MGTNPTWWRWWVSTESNPCQTGRDMVISTCLREGSNCVLIAWISGSHNLHAPPLNLSRLALWSLEIEIKLPKQYDKFSPEGILLELFDHKDEENAIRQNVGNISNNRASRPRRLEASFIVIVAWGIFISWVWQTCTTCRICKHGCTDVLVVRWSVLVVDDRLSSVTCVCVWLMFEVVIMEGTFVLLLLVVLMLVGSYLVGIIPLVMPMSEVKFKDRKEVLYKLQSVRLSTPFTSRRSVNIPEHWICSNTTVRTRNLTRFVSLSNGFLIFIVGKVAVSFCSRSWPACWNCFSCNHSGRGSIIEYCSHRSQ